MISISETVFGELRPFNVGVTVLCPTFFRTNLDAGSRSFGKEPAFTKLATKSMDKSKLQAEDVARMALASCDRGKLYCVPMSDGKWAWRIKRWAPESFFTLLPSAIKRVSGLLPPGSERG